MVNPQTDRKKNPESDSLHAGVPLRLRPIDAPFNEATITPGGDLLKAEKLIATTTKRIKSYAQSMRDGIASRSKMRECDASIKELETIFSEMLSPWFSPRQWGPLKDGMNSYQLEMWNFMLSCKFAQTGTTDFEIAPGQKIAGDFKEFTNLRDELTSARKSAASNFEQWWQTRIDQRRDFLSDLDAVTSRPETRIGSNKAMRNLVTMCRDIAHAVRRFDLSQPALSTEWKRHFGSIMDVLESFEQDGMR